MTKKAKFIQGRNGINFKDGKLYIFADKTITVLRGGKYPRCWIKTDSEPVWKCAYPFFVPKKEIMTLLPANSKPKQLLLPLDLIPSDIEFLKSKGKKAQVLFWSQFSHQERICLNYYSANRESSHLWSLVNFFVRCPGAIDLFYSNPALAYCLALNRIYHTPAVKRPWRSAKSLLFKKQKHIAGWLGFPKTKSAVKMFKKVSSHAINASNLFYLRNALKNKKASKMLSHIPHINHGVIRLLSTDLINHVGTKLIEEISLRNEKMDKSILLLTDSLKMMRELNEKRIDSFKIRSLGHLEWAHDELIYELNKRKVAEFWKGKKFPHPPIKGIKGIIPIKTAEELFAQGIQAENCVGSYAHDVMDGHCYIYRITDPFEEATLSIIPKNHRWKIDQLKGPKNSKVSEETRYRVECWLEGRQPKLKKKEIEELKQQEEENYIEVADIPF